jgi:ribonuclease G
LRWFRRIAKGEEAPTQAAAPPAPPALEAPARPAAPTGAAPEDPNKPKRRRGSRGGRGRKKPGAATTAGTATTAAPEKTAAEKAEKPTRKPREEKTERKPSSRSSSRASTRRRVPAKRPPLPKAKRELLVSVDVGEQRVAVLEDDKVAEVYLERPEKRSIAGNIYLGTVDNVLPGMEAAFVEIGLEKNGFLYVDEIVVPELEGKRHGKKIQDLISRGQEIMVQAVKDPMKTKGARLTTEISLPGRFVVFVPNGEGLGVSRRLEDDERQRLKDILKGIAPKQGGVIVRTAAEGASAEDVERDLVFLQRLWKTIETRAKASKAPALVYQEAELPLRVTRDLFTEDFERALIDDDRAFKRVTGYLKKTSPHMVERVIRYKEKTPLMTEYGVDAEIRSTLVKRVDLPSGGYLIFDYAEAFTVIDVNTGRFVGSRSKSSGARLEDTITKNNLEAVKEVVRQLRLRDIGGIIVIDFIDMANPKNRAAVEEALRSELERDRTKTYVVEISPLGLVEMTRQNVTDGPREILTKKCPTCAGDGIVVSEATAAVDAERQLRALAAKSRTQAYRVELAGKTASVLVGPGAERLKEIEAQTKRRFFVEARDGLHNDHFHVVKEGSLATLAPKAPVEEGAEIELKLVEVGLHDAAAAVGKVEGYDVAVAGAASLVGKKVKVRVERVLDGMGYATLVNAPAKGEPPITAEAEAEKPTRAVRRKATEPAAAADASEAEAVEPDVDDAPEVENAPEADDEVDAVAEDVPEDGAAPKKKTRRGSRGGRGRKKKPAVAEGDSTVDAGEAVAEVAEEEAVEAEPKPKPAPRRKAAAGPRIHVPDETIGRDGTEDAAEVAAVSENGTEPGPDGDEAVAAAAKKRTRRGSRGGRNRRKKPAGETAAASGNGSEPAETEAVVEAEPSPEPETATAAKPAADADGGSDWEYVPMSQWDEIDN